MLTLVVWGLLVLADGKFVANPAQGFYSELTVHIVVCLASGTVILCATRILDLLHRYQGTGREVLNEDVIPWLLEVVGQLGMAMLAIKLPDVLKKKGHFEPMLLSAFLVLLFCIHAMSFEAGISWLRHNKPHPLPTVLNALRRARDAFRK